MSTLLCLLPLSLGWAKLGENARGCEKLYGKPVGATSVPGLIPNGLEFHRGEYSIICGFEEDQCIVMVVLRLSPRNPTRSGIPRSDIGLFMEENFGTSSAVYTRLDSRGKYWTTYDWTRQQSFHASYAEAIEMLTLRVGEG